MSFGKSNFLLGAIAVAAGFPKRPTMRDLVMRDLVRPVAEMIRCGQAIKT
jgi:hypothetical protein